MARRPLPQPWAVATWRVRAGSGSSCPLRITRTRPGLSVNQIDPSLAKSIAQGATRSCAIACWLRLSGPGARGCGVAVGAGVGVGAGVSMAACVGVGELEGEAAVRGLLPELQAAISIS